jgi:virulence factor Mce-like protein
MLVIPAALLSASCASVGSKEAAHYCAIMPDSVGLYVDNPVTQMGYRIGKVTAIAPSAHSVRVDFIVDGGRRLPANVRAVIRSTSILADRSLELAGNSESGEPDLSAAECISLDRSLTPKSLSQVIGASSEFINSISPDGSTNVAGVVEGLDRALLDQGPGANKLLTTAASVLDSPNQAIGELGSLTANLSELTTSLVNIEPVLKSVFIDAEFIGPDIAQLGRNSAMGFEGIVPLLTLAADLETELGPQIQQLLDAVSVAVRKMTPRAPFYASLLNPVPRYVNGIANIVNNHQFNTLRYRPPLYRLRTPDGVMQCNLMNASLPGSCANVQGTPYAVDVALLQYVLTEANR